jgi:hypothetical protein
VDSQRCPEATVILTEASNIRNSCLWSSTEFNSRDAWYRELSKNGSKVTRESYLKDNGYSVRCIMCSSITGKPSVSTSHPGNISSTSAVAGGIVKWNGCETETEKTGIYWGTSPNTKSNGTKIEIDNDDGEFSTTLSGLSANTTYYVRAYSVNSNGESIGEEIEFTTLDETGTFTDAHDNKQYNWVKIGK